MNIQVGNVYSWVAHVTVRVFNSPMDDQERHYIGSLLCDEDVYAPNTPRKIGLRIL